MPADQLASCLDKIISHCKDLTKTGCFGGWAGKIDEVRGRGAAESSRGASAAACMPGGWCTAAGSDALTACEQLSGGSGGWARRRCRRAPSRSHAERRA